MTSTGVGGTREEPREARLARDREYLERAVELGERGWGRVHPNPLVGCVLVRDGEVIGEGWHRELGAPHAEVEAISAAGDARGATAYVSLEPCRHFGRTPPCTVALREAGVERIVFGAADPGTRSGGGAEDLRRAGIEVIGPLLTPREARRTNPLFFHRDTTRPWVALKLAVSLDGGIATAPGERTAVSGPEAAEQVHRLRAGFDAILVGAETARVDDPLLTVRGSVEPRLPPARVVLDGRGTLRPEARLFREGSSPVRILTSGSAPRDWVAAMREAGAEVEAAPERPDAEGRLDLAAALHGLRKWNVASLLCEGGGELASALLSAGLVDRLILVLAPRFLGHRRVSAFPAVDPIVGGRWLPAETPRVFGADLWITLDRED